MTIEDLLNVITQVIFLGVMGGTLFNWAKQRDQTHRDIALVFASLGMAILAQDLRSVLPAQGPLLTLIFFVALLVQPYLLLRVAHYFRPVGIGARRVVLVGLILVLVLFVFVQNPTIPVFSVALLYFLLAESYASFLLIQGAVKSTGLSSQRLKLASTGSGLLALIFLVSLGLILAENLVDISPSIQAGISSFIQALAILSGLSYFFGFSPPRWLRQAWQLRELQYFLQETSGRVIQDHGQILKELAEAALRAVGGASAVVAICDDQGQHLTIEIAGNPPLQIENLEALPGTLGQAWRERQARVALVPNQTSTQINRWGEQFGARAILIVPISSALRPWGLLIVALRYEPLFARDDLDLLKLFVEQSAIALDFSVLLDETKRAGELRFRTLFETMSEGFSINEIICDETGRPRDWRYLEINPAFERQVGLKAADTVGRTARELFPKIDEIWLERYGKVALSGEAIHFEAQFGPLERWFEVNAYQTEPGRFAVVFFDITERRQAEEDLRKLNEKLEERVLQRTAQLEAANKELEAFSYSVSHDLRAPLRAIDGYSRILLEDYEPVLDAEGKRLFHVISSAARRMGQLIDDLLQFSRLSRAELKLASVDMRKLAKTIFEELVHPDRMERIEFRLGELPAASGDPALLRQVWANLLSNAIKFTSQRERAVIEVEGMSTDQEHIYHVRDNGAGFDLEYAKKLFGVFERLHTEKDFEGTGVGLAIVQRIILRHGGRVWGEGQVDNGASFHFALPKRK